MRKGAAEQETRTQASTGQGDTPGYGERVRIIREQTARQEAADRVAGERIAQEQQERFEAARQEWERQRAEATREADDLVDAAGLSKKVSDIRDDVWEGQGEVQVETSEHDRRIRLNQTESKQYTGTETREREKFGFYQGQEVEFSASNGFSGDPPSYRSVLRFGKHTVHETVPVEGEYEAETNLDVSWGSTWDGKAYISVRDDTVNLELRPEYFGDQETFDAANSRSNRKAHANDPHSLRIEFAPGELSANQVESFVDAACLSSTEGRQEISPQFRLHRKPGS